MSQAPYDGPYERMLPNPRALMIIDLKHVVALSSYYGSAMTTEMRIMRKRG